VEIVGFLRVIIWSSRHRGFNTQGERRDIQQEDVSLTSPAKAHALNGGANRHHFVGFDGLIRALPVIPSPVEHGGMRVEAAHPSPLPSSSLVESFGVP